MKFCNKITAITMSCITALSMCCTASAAGATDDSTYLSPSSREEIVLHNFNPFSYYFGDAYKDINYDDGYNNPFVIIEESDRWQFYEFPSGKFKGERFCLKNGKLVTGLAVIEGNVYCFRPDGIQVKSSWVTNYNGDKFYINSKGYALKGWYKINGKSYYFKPNGVMAKGLLSINGKIYCFGTDGRQVIDDFYHGKYKKTYYIDNKGLMVTGWRKINGNYYYFDENGVMATGVVEVDGEYLEFTKKGVYKGKATVIS